MRTRGFSLVELSIVLVILGLLVGGILAGQSLIHAAELRSVNTEFQRYSTAVYAFRDKYFALPGDISNATAIWGDAGTTNCTTSVGQIYFSGTCNGDGDGIIKSTSTAQKRAGEAFGGWQQLALAGLIEGQYTGIAGDQYSNSYELGKNCPVSKVSGGCWTLTHGDMSAYVSNTYFQYDYRNAMEVGRPGTGTSNADRRIFTPIDAWNIDTKMDDGMPAKGKVIVGASVSACTTSASSSDYNGAYRVDNNDDVYCVLFFRHLR